jgi:hypothetical protein
VRDRGEQLRRRRGGEVEVRARAVEEERGAVVGAGGVLGGGEGAEPLARPLPRLPDLRHPLAPAPLPHAAVPEVAVLRPVVARLAALLVVGCSSAATLGGRCRQELAVVGFHGGKAVGARALAMEEGEARWMCLVERGGGQI